MELSILLGVVVVMVEVNTSFGIVGSVPRTRFLVPPV